MEVSLLDVISTIGYGFVCIIILPFLLIGYILELFGYQFYIISYILDYSEQLGVLLGIWKKWWIYLVGIFFFSIGIVAGYWLYYKIMRNKKSSK